MNIESFKKRLFKYLIFLGAFLLLFFNAFALYSAKYTEDFKLTYLSQRLTVLLAKDRYIELYRLHDYLTEFNSFEPKLLANDTSKTEFSIHSDDPRGINTKITEKVEGSRAEIYSELTRIDSSAFSLNRQIKFAESTDFSKVDRVYMQIIFGGGEFQYSDEVKTIYYSKCEVKLNTLTNIDMTFDSNLKVLTLSQRVFGQKVIDFNIGFTINCHE